jgi:hypothetical protein
MIAALHRRERLAPSRGRRERAVCGTPPPMGWAPIRAPAEGVSMSSYDIDLDDPPERWRELIAWLEAGADDSAPAPARTAAAPSAFEDPGPAIALYAAYLAGES